MTIRPRTCLLTALAVLASLLVGAGTATAQQPGRNGTVAWVFESLFHEGLPCVPNASDDPAGFYASGGATWSRGGGTVAFNGGQGDEASRPLLWTVSTAPCGTPVAISDIDGGSTPSFSPDSKQLAVQVRGRIHVIGVDGSYVRDLGPGLDPSWDPRGRGIAFVASDGIRIKAPTGGSSRLWKKGAVSAPDHSPDGTKIGYLSGGKIKYASSSTGGSTVTTPISARDFAWSPDGRQFIFTSPTSGIIIANTSGRITERLTDNPTDFAGGAYHSDVSWQPLP